MSELVQRERVCLDARFVQRRGHHFNIVVMEWSPELYEAVPVFQYQFSHRFTICVKLCIVTEITGCWKNTEDQLG